MKLPFDTIILINLKRRQDKKDRMIIRFADEELDKHVRIITMEATDGLMVDDDWLEKNNFKPLPDYYDPYRGRGMTMGEIGCAISHFTAWKTILDDPSIKCALILEDDAIFESGFRKKMDDLTEKINGQEWDLFYLGRKKIDAKAEKVVVDPIVEPSFSYWCLSYLVNKKGAEKLVNSNYRNALIPADEFVPIMNGTPGNFCARHAVNYKTDKFRALALKEQLIKPENWAFNSSETEKTDVYFKNNFFQDSFDKFLLLTVATEENHRLQRFRESCEYFGVPYKILGLGDEWTGGKAKDGVLQSFGGGQKVNLLRKELKSWISLEDTIVMFTDSYDVVLLANPVDILRKFRDFGTPVVFSAEKTCWPDLTLSEKYPEALTEYKFLNSGGFIGYADWIYKLIQDPIENHEDDQLYYTKKYLNSLEAYIPEVTQMEIPTNTYPTSETGGPRGWMSEPVFDKEVIDHLTATQPKDVRILDIGAGDGKWGTILKKYFSNIDAVEIFEPYLERYKLDQIYNKVHIGDFLDLNCDEYDVFILGDVFEHVSKEDAKKWLEKVKKKAKEIIVIVPFEYEQNWDGVYENKWGHHHQPNLNPKTMSEFYPELSLRKWTNTADSVGKGKGFGFYVKTYNFLLKSPVHLDCKQHIFQTLNMATNDIVVDRLGKVFNNITKTYPAVLHGNGPSEVKNFLDDAANFVSGKFDEVYGFKTNKKRFLNHLKDVCVGVFFFNGIKDVGETLDRLERLKYPKSKIDLKFYYDDSNHEYLFDKFANKNKDFKSLSFVKSKGNVESRLNFLKNLPETDSVMMMDSNYIFRNENSLKILLESDVKVLSPMIVSEKSDYANFHIQNINLKNSYKKYENRGFWTVDFISGIVLVNQDFVSVIIEALESESDYTDGDWDIKLSNFLKAKGFFSYICNTHYFGTII